MTKHLDFNAYQQRILRMLLTAAGQAITREELVANLFKALRDRCVAHYLVLLEGYVTTSSGALEAVDIRRIMSREDTDAERGRIREFRAAFPSRWRNSQLLREVMVEGNDLDFLHTQWMAGSEYAGEFLELHGKKPMWLCAVPLPPARSGLPVRALFALYDVIGHEAERDAPPPGAQQEWVLLQALPLVYGMLDYQLSTVAEEVERQRREIIMELAPRAINHEIGTAISLMRNAMARAVKPLTNLNETLHDNDDFGKLVDEMSIIRQQMDWIENIAEAFTNIEKRSAMDKVELSRLTDEAQAILQPLLKRNRITVDVQQDKPVIVHTDTALVQHVVLNVMMNAIEAIEEEQADLPAEQRQERFIHITLRQTIVGMAEILMSNNGPPIAPGYGERIFEKGVTTRPRGLGHGQGLYLCRRIAQYLEGEFGFCPPHYDKPKGANVCFRFAFPLRRRYHEDLQANVAEPARNGPRK